MLSLTATELPRFMACNGSRLMGGIPPANEGGTNNDEGDAAHWVVEQAFKGIDPLGFLDREAPNGIFVTRDMVEYCEDYIRDTRAVGGWVEVDTSYYCPGWEIRARADHIALVGTTLYVDDFKYGWKIVEPEGHWTLIWHALGWWFSNQNAVIESVVFRIYQPRACHPLGNVRHWVITINELRSYWVELHEALTNPKNTLTTSEHCYKCPSRSVCPAAQIATMNAIDVSEKAFDSHVNNEQLSFLLDQAKRGIKLLEQMVDAFEEEATHRIKSGQQVPHYSVQIDLSQKQWKKGLTPEIMRTLTGIDLSKQQLITPNQAKQRGVDEEIVEALCERNNKGLKLVRVDGSKKAEKLLGKKV